jgi:hypothetical protein
MQQRPLVPELDYLVRISPRENEGVYPPLAPSLGLRHTSAPTSPSDEEPPATQDTLKPIVEKSLKSRAIEELDEKRSLTWRPFAYVSSPEQEIVDLVKQIAKRHSAGHGESNEYSCIRHGGAEGASEEAERLASDPSTDEFNDD